MEDYNLELFHTLVYGKCSREDRRQLWTLLVQISQFTTTLSLNLVWGDFNEVLAPEERMTSGVYSHGGPSEFSQAINLSLL